MVVTDEIRVDLMKKWVHVRIHLKYRRYRPDSQYTYQFFNLTHSSTSEYVRDI